VVEKIRGKLGAKVRKETKQTVMKKRHKGAIRESPLQNPTTATSGRTDVVGRIKTGRSNPPKSFPLTPPLSPGRGEGE